MCSCSSEFESTDVQPS